MCYIFWVFSIKKDDNKFWKLIQKTYRNETLDKKIPHLRGIDSHLFLYALKWIWIQEDLNYRLSWKDTDSPVRYGFYNKNKKTMSKGIGRGKFFGALILAKFSDFTFKEIIKIIPPFG